ncbi:MULTISPECIES: class I SAM-dependent methyltransferase [unclassified Corynebacterium]|uniref:class I SAM-dependent methyltransferase n=1 Tax=unclassified Corynebacterium TaxID=2624378 RepID=UPI0029CA5FF1|nr:MULTISPECIES: class I SAM-dependent methyltransferase [unclassified Corynebacterium]WPF66376.1 class I SAM-dependent methyltransferase [Corynebacterium sp. 22KM0430]WPF68866.1 class I SAM-dependent methyltransferase [Corynebacterium sp. 21KM1197]
MADHAHNLRTQFPTQGPVGVITRGTTGYNRLRRCDRWLYHHEPARRVLLRADSPLAIDLGYGASHTTTVEWARWLRRTRADVRVLGLEIDPARVLPPQGGVTFGLGGFELAGHRPHLVRAFNVLRQYDVADVHHAWQSVTSRLAPGGLFVEGTCDEVGRRAAWIVLDRHGPRSLTLAWDPFDVERPSDVAERLPKILIHRNIPGEAIHRLLRECDAAWDHCAGWSPYGPRVRWRKTKELLRERGLPVDRQRRLLRDNVLTVPWGAVGSPA